MTRRITLIGLVIALVAIPAATALAVDDTASDEVSDVLIEGRGKLVARGVGEIELHGGGWTRIKMVGDVTIVDHAGDAEIRITSDGPTVPTDSATTIVLEDFDGALRVKGSDFTVSAEGRFRRIAAKGQGSAFLAGRGIYRATGGSGIWTVPGVRVNFFLT